MQLRKKIRHYLRRAARKKPYFVPRNWGMSNGRNLFNYRRVHTTLLSIFSNSNLKGKNICHLGAGNGQYMHYLKSEFGAKTTAIEPNKEIINQSTKKGIKPNYKINTAGKTTLKNNSQDVILADHLLYSGYLQVSEMQVVKEISRILKPKGFLILERVSISDLPKELEKEGFEIIAQEGPGESVDLNKNILVLRKK